jgi:hypothetical protein
MKLGKRLSVGEVRDEAEHTSVEEPVMRPERTESTAPVQVSDPPAESTAEPVIAHAER